jgi:hypothetical protein
MLLVHTTCIVYMVLYTMNVDIKNLQKNYI